MLCTDSTVFTTILYHSFIHSLLHTLPYSVLPRPSIHFSSICALLSNHFGSMSMYCILHSNTNIVIVFVDDSHINGYHTIGLSECYSKHSRRPGPIDVGCVCVCICVCVALRFHDYIRMQVEVKIERGNESEGNVRCVLFRVAMWPNPHMQYRFCVLVYVHLSAFPRWTCQCKCIKVLMPVILSFFISFIRWRMQYSINTKSRPLSLSLSLFLTCSILLISCAKSRQFHHG